MRVAPYRWLAYGSWGLRRSKDGGRSAGARSVPFLRGGVAVDTRDGHRYYVNSQSPDELGGAVHRMVGEARGT